MRRGRNQLLYSGRIRTLGIVTPSRISLYVLVSPCILFSPLFSGLVMSFVACPAVTTELIGDQSLRKKEKRWPGEFSSNLVWAVFQLAPKEYKDKVKTRE